MSILKFYSQLGSNFEMNYHHRRNLEICLTCSPLIQVFLAIQNFVRGRTVSQSGMWLLCCDGGSNRVMIRIRPGSLLSHQNPIEELATIKDTTQAYLRNQINMKEIEYRNCHMWATELSGGGTEEFLL